ncbi:MAG: PfkB family carbohydrate kinase [Candidatus Woesearchaeota archaeon]
MVDVIVLGAIGLDTIKTPFGTARNVLGGSAVYAACAASLFTPCGVISVKGKDLPDKALGFLVKRGVTMEGVKTAGKNFRWSGEYEFDMNEAKTLRTELNSLAGFNPYVPGVYRSAKYVFLGNTDPEVQVRVMNSLKSPELIVLDTMNYWIQHKRPVLIRAIKKANVLVLNDSEARQLFETPSLVLAAKRTLCLGVDAVIIKKGEHGSLLFSKDCHFNCPGYPLESVRDPTGCGDSFGGSFVGHYSQKKDLRKAMVYGSVIASFNAEGFGLSKLRKISMSDVEARYQEMVSLRNF